MASTTDVSSSSKSISKSKLDDPKSLKIKEEVVALEDFLSNMQGPTKMHFEALMGQLGQSQDLLKEKEEHERDAANKIASLSLALEEEKDQRVTLEASVSSLEESHNFNISKLTKERDHTLSMAKVLKNEKVGFGVDHARLLEDHDQLKKAHNALEVQFSNLSFSHEKLQTQSNKELAKETSLKIIDVPSSSNPRVENILDNLLSNQRATTGKEGLGYVSKSNNKKTKKKKMKAKL
jgi:hypothetical protein